MTKPSVVFLVNGGPSSAMAIRARSFAQRLEDNFQIRIAYRSENKAYAILQFLGPLLRVRPAVCYVFDMAFSGVIAAGLYRSFSRRRMIVDTGDAIYELSRNSGTRGPLGLLLTRLLEKFVVWRSDSIVVRSHRHQELFAREGIATSVIPDGVDTEQFRPLPGRGLRKEHHLDGFTVIGLLGSIIWNSRWQMCYGWDLIELIGHLRNHPVKALIIGDGSGLAHLKARCATLGIEDRVVFRGRVPYDELPAWINAMDICLSTQTNDTAGQVRTTGKLPLYLACGRFVLASEVGEAARVLPAAMLVPYDGTKDAEYPSRLAERILPMLDHPAQFERAGSNVEIARTQFDYSVLAAKVKDTIFGALSANRQDRPRRTSSGGNKPD